MIEYRFTADWFSENIPVWEPLFEELRPKSVLEIGSHEGRSAVWMAEAMQGLGGGRILCVDSWSNDAVRERFEHNRLAALGLFPSVSIDAIMNESWKVLGAMRNTGALHEYDLIYIDGSHAARDVLSDAVDAYHLCRHGGVIIFDDYEGGERDDDALDLPGIAVDYFLKCFEHETEVMREGYQMIVRKL